MWNYFACTCSFDSGTLSVSVFYLVLESILGHHKTPQEAMGYGCGIF